MTEGFSLYDDCVMIRLSDEVFANCEAFTCGNSDLDDFVSFPYGIHQGLVSR